MEKELEIALRKFNSAKKKMRDTAKGRYTTVAVEWVIYKDREQRVECRVYREDVGTGYGASWEEAFKDFERTRKAIENA